MHVPASPVPCPIRPILCWIAAGLTGCLAVSLLFAGLPRHLPVSRLSGSSLSVSVSACLLPFCSTRSSADRDLPFQRTFPNPVPLPILCPLSRIPALALLPDAHSCSGGIRSCVWRIVLRISGLAIGLSPVVVVCPTRSVYLTFAYPHSVWVFLPSVPGLAHSCLPVSLHVNFASCRSGMHEVPPFACRQRHLLPCCALPAQGLFQCSVCLILVPAFFFFSA